MTTLIQCTPELLEGYQGPAVSILDGDRVSIVDVQGANVLTVSWTQGWYSADPGFVRTRAALLSLDLANPQARDWVVRKLAESAGLDVVEGATWLAWGWVVEVWVPGARVEFPHTAQGKSTLEMLANAADKVFHSTQEER